MHRLDQQENESKKILFRCNSDKMLLCYYPNGQLVFKENNQLSLVKKPGQISDTCWYDGPRVMFSSLSCVNYNDDSRLNFINKYYQETGAIYLLDYCYNNFIDQFNVEKLEQLVTHPNILNINFPKDFIERLSIAISSTERKDLLFTSLEIAIAEGKEKGKKYLQTTIKKMRFDSGSECLVKIGCAEEENRICKINSYLDNFNKYCEIITIQQKDAILDKMFNILSIESTDSPKCAQDLYEMLQKYGPLLVKATIGIQSYVSNTAKKLKQIDDTTAIFGWESKNYINEQDPSLHATIILGVEVNEITDKSRVYFIDPMQHLDPNDKEMKIYSVSFPKYIQHVKNMFFLKNYGLTEEIRNLENKNNKPSFSFEFFQENKNQPVKLREPSNSVPFSNLNDLYDLMKNQKKEGKIMNF